MKEAMKIITAMVVMIFMAGCAATEFDAEEVVTEDGIIEDIPEEAEEAGEAGEAERVDETVEEGERDLIEEEEEEQETVEEELQREGEEAVTEEETTGDEEELEINYIDEDDDVDIGEMI